MIKQIILLILVSANLAAVEMTARIDVEETEPLEPVKGVIEITHLPDEAIKSFTLEGKPLQASLLDRKTEPEGRVVSKYQFEIYPEREGLNVLPAISAEVDGAVVRSNPSTYSVKYVLPGTGLHLRALVQGKEPFYPGDRLKLTYRIYYRGNVELTKETLPFFDAEEFQKIGGIDVTESEFKGYQVREFTQEVQAPAPGDYTFGQSILEGVVDGKQTIRTVVEPFTLTINPFPVQTMPPSFTEALGRFDMTARLLTSGRVRVGDKMELELVISGSGNLENAALPNLVCQPGFSGFFSLGQTPPVTVTEDGKKIFKVEIIPMTSLAKAIPSLEFSSFDPETRDYYTSSSSPIPIQAAPRPLPSPPKPPVKEAPLVDWDKKVVIEPLPAPEETAAKDFDAWNFLWAVPSLALLWLLQYYGRDWIFAYWASKKPKSPQSCLRESAKYELSDPNFYRFFRKAFQGDERKEVKDLLGFLDGIRFGKMKGSKDDLMSKAWKLV